MIRNILLCLSILFSSKTIANNQYYYPGEEAEICETPDHVSYRSDIDGKPYFIRYGDEYPNSYLTIVIWSNDLPDLEINPVSYFTSNNVCIVGEVTMFRSMPQIILRNPNQIRNL